MEVTIVQALLIGLIYYLGANGTPWLTVNMSWALRRPLISGIMVGLILGDPVKGCCDQRNLFGTDHSWWCTDNG